MIQQGERRIRVELHEALPHERSHRLLTGADPEGLVENVGTALGFLDRRVKGDLERFKEFIEGRGSETGAWRGEVEAGAQR